MSSQSEKQNLVFILSDEHNKKIAGCYGHPIAKTPNLDRLASVGTLFTSAYCNSPICVPSRASLATGQYVHDVRCWDNASPYTGTPKSWHQVLRENGTDVVSIGKLHFRGGDDYGFTEELIPLHVVEGRGDVKGLLRKDLPAREGNEDMAMSAGRGASTYSQYDERIASTATDWLARRAASNSNTPFALFISFVMPHFPLIAPDECYDLYADYDLETLSSGFNAPPSDHPTVDRLKRFFDYDSHFDDEKRTIALRAYYGMVTRLDELIGDVLAALAEQDFPHRTRIVYTSDHGDNLGNRGLWGKSVMYEDSVAVPMIVSGDGVPKGKRVSTPVSLLDIAATAYDCAGLDPNETPPTPGQSLLKLALSDEPDRVVMSEYHAAGSHTGQFMIRKRNWKYVAFVNERHQLFDLESDPDELIDLWDDPKCQDVVAELRAELEAICDPDAVDALAFVDQEARIDEFGGLSAIQNVDDIPFTPAPS